MASFMDLPKLTHKNECLKDQLFLVNFQISAELSKQEQLRTERGLTNNLFEKIKERIALRKNNVCENILKEKIDDSTEATPIKSIKYQRFDENS